MWAAHCFELKGYGELERDRDLLRLEGEPRVRRPSSLVVFMSMEAVLALLGELSEELNLSTTSGDQTTRPTSALKEEAPDITRSCHHCRERTTGWLNE